MLKFNKTGKQAISAVKDMANRLDEIDGMYTWEQDAASVLDYIEQQAARIAELERSQETFRCNALCDLRAGWD